MDIYLYVVGCILAFGFSELLLDGDDHGWQSILFITLWPVTVPIAFACGFVASFIRN